MQLIKGYEFETIELANVQIDLINQGEGIPISDDSTTRTYTQPQERDGIIFIAWDSVIEKYLGTPTDLEFNEITELP